MRWAGRDDRDCFEQRFEYTGANPHELPDSFVQRATRYDRNLQLDVQPKRSQAKYESDLLMPYYSPAGMVLLLDFLVGLADTLERDDQRSQSLRRGDA